MKQQQTEENRIWTTRPKGEDTPHTLPTDYNGTLWLREHLPTAPAHDWGLGPAPLVLLVPTVGVGPLLPMSEERSAGD